MSKYRKAGLILFLVAVAAVILINILILLKVEMPEPVIVYGFSFLVILPMGLSFLLFVVEGIVTGRVLTKTGDVIREQNKGVFYFVLFFWGLLGLAFIAGAVVLFTVER